MASAPGAALVAAAFAGGPLLAYWTQTFMDSGSRFVAQFFPIFLLGALFGKLMDDSGSVAAIAKFNDIRIILPVPPLRSHARGSRWPLAAHRLAPSCATI